MADANEYSVVIDAVRAACRKAPADPVCFLSTPVLLDGPAGLDRFLVFVGVRPVKKARSPEDVSLRHLLSLLDVAAGQLYLLECRNGRLVGGRPVGRRVLDRVRLTNRAHLIFQDHQTGFVLLTQETRLCVIATRRDLPDALVVEYDAEKIPRVALIHRNVLYYSLGWHELNYLAWSPTRLNPTS